MTDELTPIISELDAEVLDSVQAFASPPQPIDNLSSGQIVQRTQTQYVTAMKVQQPRSIARVASNVISEAKLAGDSFYWGWDIKTKQGKKHIEGGSIDLAMCCARNYGNCTTDIEVQETSTHFLFKGFFIDFETGFTCPRLFRQRKNQSIGAGYDNDRAEDSVFQIGQSKAIRNAVLNAMPEWLVNKAIEEAKEAMKRRINKEDNIILHRANIIEFFGRYAVTAKMLVAYLNGKKEDLWTADDIIHLRGIASGIKEGRVSPHEVFDILVETTQEEPLPSEKKPAKRGRPKKEEPMPEPEPDVKPPITDSKPEVEPSQDGFNLSAEPEPKQIKDCPDTRKPATVKRCSTCGSRDLCLCAIDDCQVLNEVITRQDCLNCRHRKTCDYPCFI